MEELRSPEVLEKEIREDARRRAEKVLKASEKRIADIEAHWASKTVEDLALLELRHSERIEKARTEIYAREGLDRRRARLERAERLLRAAMSGYLGSLGETRTLALFEEFLNARAGALSARPVRISFSGAGLGALAPVLDNAFGAGAWSAEEAGPSDGLLRVVAESGSTRLRFSLAEEGELLLLDKRSELAGALLGPEALDD